ncbi:MAG: IS110 family transposase, partial [Bacteroidales bacterium]|nr:IS110 family transposase [Bacteroidales bacterium]
GLLKAITYSTYDKSIVSGTLPKLISNFLLSNIIRETMQTQVTKKIDFSGKELFIGLDVHKKSWSVTILVEGMEHKTFTQLPDPKALFNYLQRMFPGGTYHSAYEAGFCGYGIHRELNDLGIKNIVINAADIPASQKDQLQKRDPIDSRKIARALEKGLLRAIHIFDRDMEELRSLNRTRFYLMRDFRRSKNRIKSFLQYYSITIPLEMDNNQWPIKFVSWLKEVQMQTLSGQDAFFNLIRSYEYHREQILTLSRQIRLRIREYDNELYSLLKTISGIGPLTSSALITELGDINRFPHIDHLSSFVGLIPRVKQSGESSYSGGITFRCNEYLRTLLIEASWQAIRQDPALMQYYHEHLINNKGQKVIIKIARKLLNRIRYVMKNRQPYVTGVA